MTSTSRRNLPLAARPVIGPIRWGSWHPQKCWPDRRGVAVIREQGRGGAAMQPQDGLTSHYSARALWYEA